MTENNYKNSCCATSMKGSYISRIYFLPEENSNYVATENWYLHTQTHAHQ